MSNLDLSELNNRLHHLRAVDKADTDETFQSTIEQFKALSECLKNIIQKELQTNIQFKRN